MPDGSVLHASEIMQLLPAPRFVVLITCEGGQSAQGQDAEDMSLAQALLLRGGEAVVAASRQLADPVAVQWTQALYAASLLLPAGGPAFCKLPARILARRFMLPSWHCRRDRLSGVRLDGPAAIRPLEVCRDRCSRLEQPSVGGV